MGNRAIPLVDLSLYRDGNDDSKEEFVEKLGEAFHTYGFVGVINHGIPKSLVEKFYAEAEAFFSLPAEVKKKYELEGLSGQRGYTSFGKEHAKHSNVADLKEFYQIGQELSGHHEMHEEYPDNVHVGDRPEFVSTGLELYRAFESSGGWLLRAIADHLELDTGYFDQWIEDGNSILRAIHYPPIIQEPDSAIRAEQHEDINLITLLVGASAGGLQILNKDDEWQDVIPENDEIVVNVGDMLQRLTNDYLKSTTHRVVNPPKEMWHIPRLSIPFFLHPRSEMDLSCLENCVSKDNPCKYEPITAGEYLDERLREIGLKK
ncbi:MAG: 2-oxoglutarate and iron-dependent oxygenase domain-containing protein [Saprospiraceae bacterium]|nr:2-oxoglutarate and iron-dependent oxygenase domain-containing protein [Saprospiraceae bacterium]